MIELRKWDLILEELTKSLGADNFVLLFSSAKPIHIDSNKVVIGIDSISYMLFELDPNFSKHVKNICQTIIGNNVELYLEENDQKKRNLFYDNYEKQNKPFVAHFEENETKISDYIEEKPKISEEKQIMSQNHTSILESNGTISTSSNDFKINSYQESHLRANFTFKNFFYSYENKQIIKACKMIIDNISKPDFNPFFLYGQSGIGKTHLINAIGNEIFKLNKNLNVYYTTATDFLEEYTNLFKGGLTNVDATDSFKEKYYKLDVLFFDDIQILEGKESTLIEFFSIFEKLRTNDKMIIITSDKKPEDIHFEERLITRFTSGLSLEIEAPNSDTKRQIFNYYADQKSLEIEESAVNIFIENSNNIRALLGYLNTITLYSINDDLDSPIFTKQQALQLINSSTGNINKLTAQEIIRIVCTYFEIDVQDIVSNSKKAKFVNARRFASYFLYTKLKLPFKKIALYLGLREHTSAMRAVREIENKHDTVKYRVDYEKLTKYMNG